MFIPGDLVSARLELVSVPLFDRVGPGDVDYDMKACGSIKCNQVGVVVATATSYDSGFDSVFEEALVLSGASLGWNSVTQFRVLL